MISLYAQEGLLPNLMIESGIAFRQINLHAMFRQPPSEVEYWCQQFHDAVVQLYDENSEDVQLARAYLEKTPTRESIFKQMGMS